MADFLTFLLTELSPRERGSRPEPDGDPADDAVRDAVLSGGGAIVAAPNRPDATIAGGTLTAAVFHLAGDAARTAVRITHALGGQRVRSFRMALCTGDAHATGATLGGPALGGATTLLRLAGPRQVLVTASTAVAASPTLPRGAELVDRGARALREGHPPERVYELRTGVPGETGVAHGSHAATAGPGVAGGTDTAASNLDWARRAVHGPVLGRDEPLAALESAWKRTLTGDRRMVLLVGDGGIGKTTVAAELALRLHAEGALVLYGRWDQGSLAPYQAVREALGTYADACPPARLRADLEGRSDEISRLLPDVVARTGGVRAPLRGDPDGERLRLFVAIEGWLDLLTERRPVLLVLDDLHWAGRSSLQLVDHLRRRRGTAPLMVVITLREGEAPPDHEPAGTADLLTRVSAEGDGVERVELAGLDPAAVAALIEQAIGRPLGPHDDEVVDWLTHDTAGNPLFVQEVLRSVTGSPDAGAALRAARRQLPEELTGVVGWRLTQLPPRTIDVLADAALLGTSFEMDLLAAATGAAPVVLGQPLGTAVDAGLLRPQEAGHYAFAHEVVRRALRERLEPARAATLHRRVADALAARARAGEEVAIAEVADHYLRGADPRTARQAVRWARAAAEAARRETAFESAVNLLSRAVEVHDRFEADAWFAGTGGGAGPGLGAATGTTGVAISATSATSAASATAATAARTGTAGTPGITIGPAVEAPADPHDGHTAVACELRLELAEAHDRAGEFGARDRRHLEAATLARELDDTEMFTRAALGFRGRLPAAPRPDRTARGLLEEALDRLASHDSRHRALVLSRLAQAQTLDAPDQERRARSDEAVAMARRLDNPVVLASVLNARCLTLDGPDDVAEQLDVGAEIIRIGERTGDPDLVLQGLRVRVTALLTVGEHDEAYELAERFCALAPQVRHPDHLRLATMWRILAEGIEGDFDRLEPHVEELRQQLLTRGHSQSTLVPFGQTVVPRWLRGELDRSRPFLDALRSAAPDVVSGWAWALWVDVATGHADRAASQLAERDPDAFVAGARRDFMWWPTMLGCTIAAVACNDRAWAAALERTLTPYGGRHCVIGYTAYAGTVDHHLGTLALVRDDIDQAIDRLTRALAQHRDSGARPFVALSARWLARALTARGAGDDHARAGALQAESEELARQLGLRGLDDIVPA